MNPKLAKRLQSIQEQLAKRQFAQADRELRHAALKFPGSVDVHLLAGQLHAAQGEFGEAIANFERCVAVAPDRPQIWNLLGRSRFEAGRDAEAATAFAREAQLGGDPAAWTNCGVAHQSANQIEPAIAAYRAAIEAGGDNYTLRLNLGMSLYSSRRYEEAADQLRAALAHAPEDPAALYDLGSCALELGEPAQAIEHFRRSRLPAAQHAALYAMNFLPDLDPDQLSAAHRAWGREAQARVAPAKSSRPSRRSGERLRVGYLSADLRAHPVMYFFEPLLASHDRQRIETICYADVTSPDDRTARARALAEHWRDIAGLGDEQVGKMIRDDNIDILVELGGHTGARLELLAQRLAPVQASYLGYAFTTGLDSIDFRITDALLDAPGDQRLYTETLLPLAPTCYAYQAPADAPEPSPSPCLGNGYLTFGGLSRAHKINPKTLALWAGALAACPGSRLLLVARLFAGEPARKRTRDAFAALGIAPDRLDFEGELPFDRYLCGHSRIDLVLDAVPWNGHTNTLHALWMGVPTLTLRGSHHAARFGEMIMTRLGLDEFIADGAADFARQASAFDQTRERLAALRGELRGRLRDSCLCDQVAVTRAIEAAYERICAPHRTA